MGYYLSFMTNNNTLDDTGKRLVIKMQQGNQQAFAKLYDKYAPMLMGLIIRLVHDKKTAEDVLQQVFIKIWEKRTVFDFSRKHLFTELIKLARNTAMEACKHNTSSNGEIFTANITVHSNETSNLLQEQRSTISTPLLANLEITSKEALDLVYFKGYSFSDAARVLNIPLSSLKEKVKMAIAGLRGGAIT